MSVGSWRGVVGVGSSPWMAMETTPVRMCARMPWQVTWRFASGPRRSVPSGPRSRSPPDRRSSPSGAAPRSRVAASSSPRSPAGSPLWQALRHTSPSSPSSSASSPPSSSPRSTPSSRLLSALPPSTRPAGPSPTPRSDGDLPRHSHDSHPQEQQGPLLPKDDATGPTRAPLVQRWADRLRQATDLERMVSQYQQARDQLPTEAWVALWEAWIVHTHRHGDGCGDGNRNGNGNGESPSHASFSALPRALQEDDAFRGAAMRVYARGRVDRAYWQGMEGAALFPPALPAPTPHSHSSHEGQGDQGDQGESDQQQRARLSWLLAYCVGDGTWAGVEKSLLHQLHQAGVLTQAQAHLLRLLLLHQQHGDTALALAYRALRQTGHGPDPALYNYIVAALAPGEAHHALAWEAYNEMKLQWGRAPSPLALEALLEASVGSQPLERVWHVHEELRAQEGRVRLELAHQLVGALLQAGEYGRAGELVLDYFPRPNTHVLNQLLRYCSETLQIDRALRLLHLLEERRVEPNQQTLDYLLHACERARASLPPSSSSSSSSSSHPKESSP